MRRRDAKAKFWRRTAFVAVCCVSVAGAVELHNWRMPYYTIASEMELLSASPSGMFWDDIGVSPLFAPAMQPDTAALRRNHWILEPAYSVVAEDPAPAPGRPVVWELEALNDLRYRNLTVRQTLHAERQYDYDSLYPAHPDRFARGRIEEAYLQLDWRYGFVRFGRMLRNWGPFIDRSLLLSSNPYSYDAIEWQVHSSMFEFRQLFAAFVPNEHFPDSADNLSGRFFAAHALNVMFGKWATVGAIETMVFRRANGFPDFQYVNPFSVYSVTNTNQEGGGNLMLGLQWNIHPGLRDLSLRGQLALDDIQVDHTLVTDKEQTHWGPDVAAYWRDALPLRLRHVLKAGYQRRSEWIYTVQDDDRANGEQYTYLSKGLGAPKNDGDSVWAGFSVIGEKCWVGTATMSYSREGEKNVTSRWQDSNPLNTSGLPYDNALGLFPSGIVQSTMSIALEGAAYFKDYADFRIGIANRWIRNKDHISSNGFRYSPQFSVMAGFHFSGISAALPE